MNLKKDMTFPLRKFMENQQQKEFIGPIQNLREVCLFYYNPWNFYRLHEKDFFSFLCSTRQDI